MSKFNRPAPLTTDRSISGCSIINSLGPESSGEYTTSQTSTSVPPPSTDEEFTETRVRSHSAFSAPEHLEKIENEPEDTETNSPLANFSPKRRAQSMFLHEAPVVHVHKVSRRKLEDGTKMINDYYILDLIGMGSYSKVKLCCHRDDKTYYALKILLRSRLKVMGIGTTSGLNKLRREVAILKKLRHPHIIALQEVIDDPHSHKMYLVFELALFGQLMAMNPDGSAQPDDNGNNRIKEAEALRICNSSLEAIAFAHENGVAHRDIKPQNILLTENAEVKLSDFGVSAMIDDSPLVNCTSKEGTIVFLPPELLQEIDVDSPDGALRVDLFKADIWSLAVTMYVIVSGWHPYGDTSEARELLEKIKMEPIDKLLADRRAKKAVPLFSAELEDFLQHTMCYDPQKRFGAAEALAHPWVQGRKNKMSTPPCEANVNSPTEPKEPGSATLTSNRSSCIELDDKDVENAISHGRVYGMPTEDMALLPPKPKYIFIRKVPCYSELYFSSANRLGNVSPDNEINSNNNRSFAFDDSVLHMIPEDASESFVASLSPKQGSESSNSPQSEKKRRATSQPPVHQYLARRVNLMGHPDDKNSSSMSGTPKVQFASPVTCRTPNVMKGLVLESPTTGPKSAGASPNEHGEKNIPC